MSEEGALQEGALDELEGDVEGSREEAAPSKVDVAIAATLISTISFVMYLYCFINFPDDDIQEMTWMTISRTISIFCAVLMFSSSHDLIDTYFVYPLFGEGQDTLGALGVNFVVMLVCFAAMQLVVAFCSGAEGPKAVDMDEFEEMSDEKKEDKMRRKRVNVACYGVLSAHITGFASINTFITLQQQSFFAASWWQALLVVPIVLVFMMVLQRVTDCIRESISIGDDGEKNAFEELWDAECEDAENEVMGFALSFSAVNALRFMITGCLPNQEGKEEVCTTEEYLYHHTALQTMALMGLGFFFALVIFLMRVAWPDCLDTKAIRHMPKVQQECMSLSNRFMEGIFVACCMAFSWSFFYGFQMLLAQMYWLHERLILGFVLALSISFLCFALIVPLDKLADAKCTGPKVDLAIRSIISAMGLLIGFCWEQCFEESVWAIATRTEGSGIFLINSHTTKFLLSIFCAALLVPAWKWYILTYIVAEGWDYQFSWKIEDIELIVKKHVITGELFQLDGEIQEDLDEDDERAERIDAMKRVSRLERVLLYSTEDVRKIKQNLISAQTVGKRAYAEDAEPLLPPTASPMQQSSWVPPPGWSPPGWVPYIEWDPNLMNSQTRWVPSRELEGAMPSRELPRQINGAMNYPSMGFPFGHEANGFR